MRGFGGINKFINYLKNTTMENVEKQMKRVSKVNKCITGWNPYPDNVRQELLNRFGCLGENAN